MTSVPDGLARVFAAHRRSDETRAAHADAWLDVRLAQERWTAEQTVETRDAAVMAYRAAHASSQTQIDIIDEIVEAGGDDLEAATLAQFSAARQDLLSGQRIAEAALQLLVVSNPPG